MSNGNNAYLGNQLLKSANVQISYTKEQLEEYIRCSQDPIYFIEKYIKIVSLDEGIVKFEMYEFQKEIVRAVHNNRFTISKIPRQSGKTTCIIAYFIWYVLFNPNSTLGIIANKATTAKKIMDTLKISYENLPQWLSQGITEYNKNSITFENGSKIIASATSSTTARSNSYNCISGDSIITIRDCNDGSIFDISIEDFYNKISILPVNTVVHKSHQKVAFFPPGRGDQEKESNRWEVLTAEGFKYFRGVSKTPNKSTIKISTAETSIVCTPDHQICSLNGFLEAKHITVTSEILTSSGYSQVISVEEHRNENVYDLLHVENTHSFFANKILVHNCVLIDEFAFVPQNIAEQFFSAVYPTITAGSKTKIIIISTPNGMNHFHKLWVKAKAKKSEYVAVECHWYDIPGRGEEFKRQTIANTSQAQWDQEFECQFLGSTNTLISGSKLAALDFATPLSSTPEGVDMYAYPEKDHIYAMTVDTARGQGEDYHAFTVVDITQMPYKLVCKFRNNTMSHQMVPNMVKKFADYYNEALVLIEIMDLGQSVAETLHDDLEYSNIVKVSQRGKGGQRADAGFGGKTQLGLRTTHASKILGCNVLKDLIENDKLLIQDLDIISEFSTFVSYKTSYEATEGDNDDLVSCLVLFSWLTTQTYYKDYTNSDIRKKLFEEHMKRLEEQVMPFGFRDDGLEPPEEDEIDIFDERTPKQRRDAEMKNHSTDW